MKTSVLFSQKATFAEHNATLFFVLGLASVAPALLDGIADEKAGVMGAQAVRPALSPEDDDLYALCLLGMVVLAREVACTLEAERCRTAAARAEQPDEPEATEIALPPLLR